MSDSQNRFFTVVCTVILLEAQAQQLMAFSEASVGNAKADMGRAVLARVLTAKPK